MIFGSSDESAEKSQLLIDVFLTRQVDAIIIAPTENTEHQIKALQKRGVPVVLVDRYFPNMEPDGVMINKFQAAYQELEVNAFFFAMNSLAVESLKVINQPVKLKRDNFFIRGLIDEAQY